ncbi:hypothetical protein GCM10011390_08250 [Aureimonas endophytica]|uniref:PilZ domain-containing protein n=1 Tax=Aureimonas endophytica TaxID=2027858 RepID=A0A916ZEE5_9HYPH|nr:PilZ domain-containing protein [Aureimonas endophytica]GGD91872.1 hypothetical protein GCM10011390_08250 [Aureimonas endophytica]
MSALIYEEGHAAEEADGAERRIAPRTKVLKRAQVLFNNNFSVFDCVVRNISSTGALLTIDEAAHLPKEFGVRIGDDRTIRPARLVYRRGTFAGIRFLDFVDEEEELTLPNSPMASAAPPEAHPSQTIAKLVPEPLPRALTRHFRWN